MKIISKFTDFYEYDCYRYGTPDQSIVWVREQNYRRFSNSTDNEQVNKLMKTMFLSPNAKSYIGKRYGFGINIVEQLVGIYPYIYYIPVIQYDDYGNRFSEKKEFSVEDSLKCLTTPLYYKEIMKEYGLNIKDYIIPEQILRAGKTIKSYSGEGRDIINDPIVVENKEVFESLQTPVFAVTSYGYRMYNETHLITDCNIIENTHLLRAFPNISFERDIYNDIENFLWSQKQEKMVIPDNTTKIISHGFDTKTSFRKM